MTSAPTGFRPGERFAEVYFTADLRTEFYRPTRPGRIRATGWVVRKTRRVTFAASELHDEDGTLLASCRATNITIDLRDEPRRARRAPARPISD
jgi:acyl-coenzyme A thioesterase PaaI-like protein